MSVSKARKGQPLNIRAQEWNQIADAVNRFGNQYSPGGQRVGPELVWVKNSLGRDLSRWSAVCICDTTVNELATGQNDQVYQIVNGSLAMRGTMYGEGEPVIGILQEPIANGRIGLAQISGVTPASFRYNENGSTSTGDYADISDLDDKLTFCGHGPIRVISRTQAVNVGNSSKFYLVELGTAASIGSACWISDTITWTSILGNNYGNIWDAAGKFGDAVRVGLYQVGTTTELRIGRVGRYQVIVDWSVATSGLSSGDRVDLLVRWPASNTLGALVAGGASEKTFLTIPPAFSTDSAYEQWSTGQQVFSIFTSAALSAPAEVIPLPAIKAVKTTSGGSTSNITVTGKMRVHVIRLGAGPYNTVWTEAQRDTAWARGSSAGPV